MDLGPNQLKWLEALESGQFKQGRNLLHQVCHGEEQYCCLGVACAVFGIKRSVDPDATTQFRYGEALEPGYAPTELIRLMGFHTRYGGYGPAGDLAKANDEGETFKNIAIQVREKPELYFERSV